MDKSAPKTTGKNTNFVSEMRDLENINPLIDSTGDTTKVQSVLRTLQSLIDKEGEADGSTRLSSDESFGVCIILDACSSALAAMEPIHRR